MAQINLILYGILSGVCVLKAYNFWDDYIHMKIIQF